MFPWEEYTNIEEGKVQQRDYSGFTVWVGKMITKE